MIRVKDGIRSDPDTVFYYESVLSTFRLSLAEERFLINGSGQGEAR